MTDQDKQLHALRKSLLAYAAWRHSIKDVFSTFAGQAGDNATHAIESTVMMMYRHGAQPDGEYLQIIARHFK